MCYLMRLALYLRLLYMLGYNPLSYYFVIAAGYSGTIFTPTWVFGLSGATEYASNQVTI